MHELDNIRNIGIVAHIDAGKTTATEGMLFFSGLTHRFGNIDQGNTVMDFLPEERARGITITAAAASLPWADHLIHLIDTPGHIDFTAEVERSLRVIDGAVVLFSGVEGVEAQSEKVWRQADKYQVPKIAFINKLDRVGAVFPRVVAQINEKFGRCALPIQAPVGAEEDFTALLDLVAGECLRFSGPNHESVSREPVPEALQETYARYRSALVERLADASDAVAQYFLEDREVPTELLGKTIRELTLKGAIVPVLAGSAKRKIGIQPLMDAVVAYLPSPSDLPDIPAHASKGGEPVIVHPDSKEPFAGLIFKVVASPSADLFYVRTYTGTLKTNATLCNSRTRAKVRAKQVLRLYAKNTQPIDQVGPGDIVGVIGPRECGTGDTLCDVHHLVAFEKISFPDPVIAMAIEPRFGRDKERLDEALSMLCREDPTLSRSQDEETGQCILAGMGELHLEISQKHLANDFHLEVKAGEPRVAYRETLRGPTLEKVTFTRTFGDTELFAEVLIYFEPLPHGEQTIAVRTELQNKSSIAKDLLQAAEHALTDGLRTGGRLGFPLIYVAAELRELKIHAGKTTEGAVVGAVLQAIGQAVRQVGTSVLEPVMHLEILTPDESVGEISMYLHPRRAIIQDMSTVHEVKRIACQVPLAEMFGFGKALPKLSGGRATFSMAPCGYQELPPPLAQQMFGPG